jgi:hypothetical protein
MAPRSSLETIAALTTRIAGLETDRARAVAAAIRASEPWAEIGPALGVTAQAAHKRFRWLRYSPITGETWHEPPLLRHQRPPADTTRPCPIDPE